MLKAEHKSKELEVKEVIIDDEQSGGEDSEGMTGEIRGLLENSTVDSAKEAADTSGTEQGEKSAQQSAKPAGTDDEQREVEQSTNEATETGQMVVTDELIEMHPILKSRKGQPIEEALKDYSQLRTAYGRTAQELAALKKVNNASEVEATQQEKSSGGEYPDPLNDHIAYRDAVLADARQIVDEGLKQIQPLRAESAEKEIIKAIIPKLPKEIKAEEALESFKNDMIVNMSPEEREERIDHYEKFPNQFILDISNHAKVQAVLKNANSEEKADTFKNTRDALKNAAEHTDDKAEFNNARVVEEESPEDELLSQIASNIDEDEYDNLETVE